MGQTAADFALVDAMAEVWDSIGALAGGLDAAEWKIETECPGWSVQDNVAHIVGIESAILGRPNPDHTPPDAPHVRNDVARVNEVWVDWYRSRPGAEVLAEFRAVTDARLAQLRAPDVDFDADAWTPIGPGTVRDMLPFRIFDSFVHEQDMRRAVARPGGWDGERGHRRARSHRGGPADGRGQAGVAARRHVGRLHRDRSRGAGGHDRGRRRPRPRRGVRPDPPVTRLELDGDTFVRLEHRARRPRGDPRERRGADRRRSGDG